MTALRACLAFLLAALMLAVSPAYAAADLSIAIARSGVFKLGNTVSYTLTVTNNGAAAEIGKITIGGSASAGLTFTGASGAGWTCGPGGALGICSYIAGVAPNAKAPALTLTVQASTEGAKSLSATVTGSNDPVAANNTATDTATAFGPADLAIAIVRSGTFQVGRSVTYAATVTNKGPGTEFGTITVGGTVAPGLTVTGVSGAGWTCAIGGTLGTCTYGAGLAPNAQAALTITALVNTEGQKTVTASVTGNADPNSANNTATDSGTALPVDPPPAPPVTHYALTDRACAIGVKIGDANACRAYTGPITAGRTADIHLTATDADGKAKAPPTATVSMQFALRCINPAATAGVKARIEATELEVCAPQTETLPAAGRWGAVDVAFAAGQASKALRFQYADVGQVELHLREGATSGTAALFVSTPWMVDFRRISRGGIDAPAVVGPSGQAFAMAGDTLLVEIGARVEDAGKVTWAPNFGNEAARPALTLEREALFTDPSHGAYLPNAPALAVDAASWKSAGGTVSVNASWGEVGATAFTVGLSDYLAAGAATGARQDVGRFYPAWFSTEISAPLPCGSIVACPAPPLKPVGLAYSGQPFNVRVVARGVQGQELRNFTGMWFRTIRLSAIGGNGTLAAGVLAPAQLTTASSGVLTHTLPNPWSALDPRSGAWSAPTTLRLRAQAQDGPALNSISSNRSPGISDEDALVVLSGRLRVANALGTDLLRTPLALRVEYWSGSAWRGHPDYTDPLAVDAALAAFSQCTRTLAGTKTPCNTALVGVSPLAPTVALKQGAGVLWLRAPGKQAGGAQVNGRHRDGSVAVRFDGWTWLPSTLGRVTFGSHRSPLIYVREVY